MIVEKIRDLTIVNISDKNAIVVACDSCGSIGMKKGDVLKIPPFYSGKFTARVGIMEVLCTGAEVVTIVDTVSNEMEPTGNEIIRGIKEELKAANINEVVLTGSTEENFPTISTALGVL
jgi:selenophosphate synthetase-related protein